MINKPQIKDLHIYYRELNDYYIEIVGWISRKKSFIEEMNTLDRDYYVGDIKYLVYEKKKKRLLGKYEKRREVINSYNIEINRLLSFAQKKVSQINLITLSDDSIENLLKNSSYLKYSDIERLKKEVFDLEIKKQELDNKLNYNQERIEKEREEEFKNFEKSETSVFKKPTSLKFNNRLWRFILKFFYGSNYLDEVLTEKEILNKNLLNEKESNENVNDDKKQLSRIEKEKHQKVIKKKEEKIKLQVINQESISIKDFTKSYLKIFGFKAALFKDIFLYIMRIGYWNISRLFNKDNGFSNEDFKNMNIDKTALLNENKSLTGLDKRLQNESLKELNKNIDQIKSENLRDEVSYLNTRIGLSGMFSRVSPVSNMLVRKFSSFIVNRFPVLFRSLYDDLRSANINILSISYLSIAIFSSLLGGSLFFLISLLFFRSNINFLYVFEMLFFSILISAGVFIFFFIYPKIIRESRKKNITRNLPFGLINFSALVISDADMVAVFKTISLQKDLGEFANEFEKIYKYIFYFGYDITQAIGFASLTTPSPELQDFLDGFLTTFQSGGDLKLFVSEKSEDLINTYELKQEKNVQKMSTISDVYTAIMIAAPLFLVAILSMVGMLGGNIGGMPIDKVILLGTYAIIPLMNIGFIVFIASSQEE